MAGRSLLDRPKVLLSALLLATLLSGGAAAQAPCAQPSGVDPAPAPQRLVVFEVFFRTT